MYLFLKKDISTNFDFSKFKSHFYLYEIQIESAFYNDYYKICAINLFKSSQENKHGY